MPREMLLGPGDRLGRYEILRSIGVGGMAELYVARARGVGGFEKLVALKRILPELARDSDFLEMFLDEARLAAGLSHPNVVTVYDIGSDDNGYFFAMEYLHGDDVAAILKTAAHAKQPLALGHALAIVTGAAAGVHHAHEARDESGEPLGIVHRDVSPTNILVTYEGGVKVVDFGIAKALSRRTKTVTGRIKGKVAYLSPEQCRGEDLDRRSDVFALGIVLFELTTGTRMFGKMDDFAIMHRIASGKIDAPSARRDEYSPELERIVMRALAHDRDERYESARELELELSAFARENKLDLSSHALAELMRSLYGEPRPMPDASDASPVSRTVQHAGESTTASLSASIPGVSKRTPARWVAAAAVTAVVAATVWWSSTNSDVAETPARSAAPPTTPHAAETPPVRSATPATPSAAPSAVPVPSRVPTVRRPIPKPAPTGPTTHDGLL